MKVSFSVTRKLCIGILLGIVLLGATFSVLSLRRVAEEMHQPVARRE